MRIKLFILLVLLVLLSTSIAFIYSITHPAIQFRSTTGNESPWSTKGGELRFSPFGNPHRFVPVASHGVLVNKAHLTNDEKLIPKINKNPKYRIILKGYIDPKLKKQSKLKWDISYSGIKSICPQVADKLKNGVFSRQIHEFIYSKPDKKGNYRLKIYLDKYLPGYCQWSISSVRYSILNTLDKGVVNFSRKKMGAYKNKTTIDVIFQKNEKSNTFSIIKSGIPLFNEMMTYEIYDQDSYELTLNLLVRKGELHATSA